MFEKIDNEQEEIKNILEEMKNYANENNVPIIKQDVAEFLGVMGRIIKPFKILEIGTAIGYSSILLSQFLADGGRIDTIERNLEMLIQARKNIKTAKKENQINIIEGQAVEILNFLEGKYDIIFLDGAKGQYKDFLFDCIRLLKKGGVLIADNVLYKGMVTGETYVKRRNKTIVRNLKDYINEIKQGEYFKTSIIPLGDGISVSYKIKD